MAVAPIGGLFFDIRLALFFGLFGQAKPSVAGLADRTHQENSYFHAFSSITGLITSNRQ